MLLFSDSFDDRPITMIGDRYSAHQYNISAGSGIYAARTGNGLGLSTGILDVADYITWQGSSVQSLYVGIAWEQGYQNGALCSIRYNGTAQIYAQLNSDRTISVIRFDAGANTVLATSSQTIPSSPLTTFFYVELYGKIHNSDGAYELRVDGTRWLSASGIDTSSTGDALANEVRITNLSAAADGAYSVVDDFYIADDNSDGGDASIVGFAGPVKIACRMPASNGGTVEWTPNTGTNYAAVDDFGRDDDTTYVAGDTVGEADSYGHSALEVINPTVKAVAVHYRARKEDALARTFYPIARVGAVEYRGDVHAVTNSYAQYFRAFERNPATNTVWTRETVSAAQFGAEVAT